MIYICENHNVVRHIDEAVAIEHVKNIYQIN